MDVFRLIIAWLLLISGMIVCAGGLVWILTPTIPWLGRLPGDIDSKRKNFDFYFPLTSSIVACIVVALVFFGGRLLLGS